MYTNKFLTEASHRVRKNKYVDHNSKLPTLSIKGRSMAPYPADSLALYLFQGSTPEPSKPRYHIPMSVSCPSAFKKVALGPTLLTSDLKAPK